MSVGFGFSIGDLIAVGNLALQVIQALNESGGAKEDYESLCELLLSLHRSIQAASTVFLQACLASNEGSIVEIAPLNGIRHELECCKRLMEKFMASAVKYTNAFSGGGGWQLRRQCKKVAWVLYKADDVRKLQASLQGHFGAFQLYTSALVRQSLARTEKKVTEGTEMSHRIFAGVMEMMALLKTLQDDIPKNIGYQWEGGWGQDEKPIHFEDALGRVVLLPILLCSSSDSFRAVLKIMFKGLPGQKRIAQEEYEITEDSEGTIIRDSDWQYKVSPGIRIAMSILIRGRSETIANNCPRCSTPHIGTKSEKGELRCRFCHLVFRNFDVERIVELPDTPEAGDTVGAGEGGEGPPTPQTSSEGGRGDKRGPREEDAFRRIHYYRETLRWENLQPLSENPKPNLESMNTTNNLGKHRCPHCYKTFTSHHSFKSHLLAHAYEKPFLCRTCQSQFRRLHDLKRHTKLHTGERPHVCMKCGRRFALGDSLARHARGGVCTGKRGDISGIMNEGGTMVTGLGQDEDNRIEGFEVS